MSPRDDDTRLRDIRESIAAIKAYTPALDGDDAHAARMALDAVKYHLVVIGEAAGSIDGAARERSPEVPWSAIKGLRNILTHQYFRVDLASIREVVTGPDLRALERAVQSLLAEGS